MSVVYIGRGKVNLPNDNTPTLIINEECISSFHASLELLENNTMLFSDRNSRNGIFKIKSVEKEAVYKQLDDGTFSKNRIQKGTLHPDESLVFGRIIRSFDELQQSIQKITNASRNNWIREFSDLEVVFSNFNSEMKRVKRNHDIVGHLTRAGVALGCSIALPFANEKLHLGLPQQLIASLPLITLPPVLQMLNFPNGPIDDKLRNTKRKYEPLYRCPKCFTPFNDRLWIDLKSGGCPSRCGALYQ